MTSLNRAAPRRDRWRWLRRFGPQSSANLRLVQNVFSFSHDIAHTRERHLFKFGALAERFQQNMVNPTFSLGI